MKRSEKSPPKTSLPLSPALSKLFSQHARRWRNFNYLYPVISRRSRGLSIGINVNVDRSCTFDCVYCSVDHQSPPACVQVDLNQLRSELDHMIGLVQSGSIWNEPEFSQTPPSFRRLNDIAFSGDGEPTLFPQLDKAAKLAAEAKKDHNLPDVKLILVTNSSGLHNAPAQRALETLDANQGEVWAKLDAGTEAYFQLINRSQVEFKQILRNILTCGLQRPLVIQSMFLRYQDALVPREEMEAYTERLAELILRGCQIRLVQLYTVARATREQFIQPIGNNQLDRLADLVRKRLPMIETQVFYKPA